MLSATEIEDNEFARYVREDIHNSLRYERTTASGNIRIKRSNPISITYAFDGLLCTICHENSCSGRETFSFLLSIRQPVSLPSFIFC